MRKVKTLLINPYQEPDIDSNLPSFINQIRGSLPPLGLMYIASNARKAGFNIEIFDCNIRDNIYKELDNEIEYNRYNVIGITSTTFTLLTAIELAKHIKTKYKDIKIVLGGIHASIYPEESASLDYFDYIVCGEGEFAFVEVLNKIEDGTIKDNEIIKANGFIQDLDSLPMPIRSMTDYTKYKSSLDSTDYITTIMTSRGCPYQCTFCHRPHMGKQFRGRSADSVMEEIEDIKSLGINEITFYDDTFAVDRQRVIDICDMIIKGNYNIKWDIRTRVNLVDREMLHKLKLAGCKQIRYGVEAGDNKTLKHIKKGITLEQAENAIKMSKQEGIETLAYFILFNPYESIEDVYNTIKFAKKLNPNYVYFSIMTPYPATPLYYDWLNGQENYNNNNRYDHWTDFANNPREIHTPYYQDFRNRHKMEDILKYAYQSFYLRPGYISRYVFKIRSGKEFARGIKIAGKLVVGK